MVESPISQGGIRISVPMYSLPSVVPVLSCILGRTLVYIWRGGGGAGTAKHVINPAFVAERSTKRVALFQGTTRRASGERDGIESAITTPLSSGYILRRTGHQVANDTVVAL